MRSTSMTSIMRRRISRASTGSSSIAACRVSTISAGSRPQETNVYGGLAVALPFIHARPRYFGEVIAELLFWLGPEKILFGSDYAIWTPRWLVEKFWAYRIPEDIAGAWRRADRRDQGEDPGSQRRASLRHRREARRGRSPVRPSASRRSEGPWRPASISGGREKELWRRLVRSTTPNSTNPSPRWVSRAGRGDGRWQRGDRLPPADLLVSPNFAFLMLDGVQGARPALPGACRSRAGSTTTCSPKRSSAAWRPARLRRPLRRALPRIRSWRLAETSG